MLAGGELLDKAGEGRRAIGVGVPKVALILAEPLSGQNKQQNAH